MNTSREFLFETARRLMIGLIACVSLLCLRENAVAQCDYSSIFSSNSSNTASLPFDVYNEGYLIDSLPPATNSIAFSTNCLINDPSFAIDKSPVINQSFFIPNDNTLTLGNNGILAADTIYLDGTLRIENGGQLGKRTILFVSPNGVLDLQGTTFTISALILSDGTKIPSENNSLIGQDQKIETCPLTVSSMRLSNGGQVINGTLIIDPTQTEAPIIDERPETASTLFSSFISYYLQQ